MSFPVLTEEVTLHGGDPKVEVNPQGRCAAKPHPNVCPMLNMRLKVTLVFPHLKQDGRGSQEGQESEMRWWFFAGLQPLGNDFGMGGCRGGWLESRQR